VMLFPGQIDLNLVLVNIVTTRCHLNSWWLPTLERQGARSC